MKATLLTAEQSPRGKWNVRFEAEDGRTSEGYYYINERELLDANGYGPFIEWFEGPDGLRYCRSVVALNKAAHTAALELGIVSLPADHWREKIRGWDAAEEARVAALPEPPDYSQWLAATFPTADSRWGQGMTGKSCRDVYNSRYVQPRTVRHAPKAWSNALERALQAGL